MHRAGAAPARRRPPCRHYPMRPASAAGDGPPPPGTEEESSAQHAAAAAALAVSRHVSDGCRVGLSRGGLAAACAAEIGRRLGCGELSNVVAVPCDTVAAAEAALAGVPLTNLNDTPEVDVALLEVDELAVDAPGLPAVFGRMGSGPPPELGAVRAVLSAAGGRCVALCPASGAVARLGGDVPVLVELGAWEETAEELDDAFLGDAELWRRPQSGEVGANPQGGATPHVNKDGSATLVDLRFVQPLVGARLPEGLRLCGKPAAPEAVAEAVVGIGGVVDHGLLLGEVAEAIVPGPGEPSLFTSP